MPSLFSRSRTNSTPNKKHSLQPRELASPLDEFGRTSSRGSTRSYTVNSPTPPGSKKDKGRAKEQEKRLWSPTSRSQLDYHPESLVPSVPDGSFLPLNLERPRIESGLMEQHKEHNYGYLSYERHVVLGIEHVARLVEVVSEELITRGGITTPFIFSTTALDVSSSAIKRLIRSFLNTCVPNSGQKAGDAEKRWREEARFAEPHELGMCLRWGLARVVRSVGGHDVRGLIAWDLYMEFRESEAALGYPPAHFATMLPMLPEPLQPAIIALLTLLSRLTANSTTSGHTPPTLSPLFGPLLFGLGPATLAFHHTYIHYLRAAHAMEHILLAFIRWQDSPRPITGGLNISGSAAALGVPTRLKEWIKGYPSMLPIHERGKNDKPQARRGARTVRVMSVRRNVRMYSPDLVKTAATWAHRSRSGTSVSENGLAVSKEWDRIAPASLKLPPRYSEAFKKRMNMPPNFHPESTPGTSTVSPSVSTAPSAASYSSTTSASTSGGDHDYFGLGERQAEDRFRSLTDLKWGEFESMGFSELGDQKKLQFDLTESARTERSAKRQTLSWNDFSSSGFSRTDGPLSATLQFSAPVIKSVSTWPTQSAEMSRKLKKTQKQLPAFGWDTEPVVGSEEVIEESFVDVFCDLVYGGGWMDLERYEEFDRDCNWALVEFKSLPPSRTTASGGSDPRTATTLMLFEEFVPLEYRQQLALPPSSRRRIPSLFTPSKSKQWKQAATLNGRPYVVGHVPRSPSYREVEFEGLLRGGSGTKVISLGAKPSARASHDPRPVPEPATPTRPTAASAPLYIRNPELRLPAPLKSEELPSDSTMSPSVSSTKRVSLFRLPGGIPVPSPGGYRKSGIAPAEYSTVEFETRLASYSDDEVNGAAEPEAVKQKRRQSKDDAWVDILVGTQAKRVDEHDAEPKEGEGRRRVLSSRRSDPDMASLEVAQVLAAVRDNRPLSVVNLNDRVDRDYGVGNLHDHLNDQDVDEIETVPRNGDARAADDEDDEDEEVSHYTAEPSSHHDHDHDHEDADDELDQSSPAQRAALKQQRRLGYFDLHPERRRPLTPVQADDPRDRLAYDDSEDEADDEDRYGPPQPPAQPSAPPIRKLPVTPDTPRTLPVTPTVELTRQSEPATAPLVAHSDSSSGNDELRPVATSKTAALIEMYRERERNTPPKPAGSAPLPPAAVPQPSRLPVRSLTKEGGSLSAPQERATATASPIPTPPIETTLTEPTRIVLEESGRTSPARYVHGQIPLSFRRLFG